MTGETRRPLWPWVTAAIVLLVLYVGSFGPACWLHDQTGIGESAIPVVYYPIILLAAHTELSWPINQYATRGRLRAKYPMMISDGSIVWGWDEHRSPR